MPNKDSLVILPNGEVVSHPDFQSDLIVLDEENRQKVILLLRQIPAFLDVAKKSMEGKTYQAVFPPEVLKRMNDGSARLDKQDNGLFGVLIRDIKTGHITDHVSLKEVTPDLLSSLNQLATQRTLAVIVHRLEVLDGKITDVLQGQTNDRLAEVESGIDLYEQAVAASDPDTRRDLLGNAIQNLNDGRNELLRSTDFNFIDKLPRNRIGMFVAPISTGIWDIPKHIQSKAKSAWEAAHGIVEASRYLLLAYSALNEPGSLRVSLEQVASKVKAIQDKMGKIVNWLSPESNWRESLMTISLAEIPQRSIVIEFQPKEIAPPEGI